MKNLSRILILLEAARAGTRRLMEKAPVGGRSVRAVLASLQRDAERLAVLAGLAERNAA